MLRFLLLLVFISAQAQGGGSLQDYQRAEQFLPKNVARLISGQGVRPQWLDDHNRFWYISYGLADRKTFLLVDPLEKTSKPAFDHRLLAEKLSKQLKRTFQPEQLPFDRIQFPKDKKGIGFDLEGQHWFFDALTGELTSSQPEPYVIGQSPDKQWRVVIRNHNLILSGGEEAGEQALTTDGEPGLTYGFWPLWDQLRNESAAKAGGDPDPLIIWSSDSRRFIAPLVDRRKAKKMWLLQNSTSDMRAVAWSYERALPGDPPEEMPTVSYYLFAVDQASGIKVDLPGHPAYLTWDVPRWSADNSFLTLDFWNRGYQAMDLIKIDPISGKTRALVEERAKTCINPDTFQYRLFNQDRSLLFLSEREGWSQIYVTDIESGKTTRLTGGGFVVETILALDEERGLVYFSGLGSGPDDPYFRNIFSLSLSGGEQKLLSSIDSNHYFYISPDNRWFVDNASRVDQPGRSTLFSLPDGKPVMELEQTNIDQLTATGWQLPEPFRVKARDGKTDLYGLMFKPANFDPGKSYPILDGTYSGPQAVRTPKLFREMLRGQEQAIAQLGFILITIDGLGTANRGKVFQDFSYRNLGDIGAADHMGAIKQLAANRPYMDLERVGIYGHSAGGYDAARAILLHPEFYKAAVAASGNHDHRMSKIWWPELWMGLVGDHYREQSNLEVAGNLKGKLLLVTGEMDSNVNPASTMRLAARLIEEDRDFELLILPDRNHGINTHPYYLRRLWDHFVKNLLGVTPPEFHISRESL